MTLVGLIPASLEAVITPRTRAVIPIHFAGHCCEMDAIHELARRHSLRVITDAAHALGAEYRGRKVGELSEMAILSFHPVKHITTGEGGMVLGACPVLRESLRSFRHHAIIVTINFRTAEEYHTKFVALLQSNQVFRSDSISHPEILVVIFAVPPPKFRSQMVYVIKVVLIEYPLKLMELTNIASDIL